MMNTAEDVVHVLHRVHRWLRPGGRVLDIHPEPEDARVEVSDGNRVTFVGPYARPAIYDNIHRARDMLAGLVGEGLFAPERSTVLRFGTTSTALMRGSRIESSGG